MSRSLLVLGSMLIGCASEPLELVAVTFNTGTSEGMGHDEGPDDGYTSDDATISDQHYGDGLAWQVVVDDVRAFLSEVRPDVIGFQEIFDSAQCPSIPSDAWPGFVCESWSEGDPTVAQVVLGEGYQVACHLEKWDKCLGVRTDFATVRGCDGDICRDFLDGAEVDTCGSGSRIGRAVLDLADGSELTVVNVHGSSGFAEDDMACRTEQFRLVFEDLDGAPAASGHRNLVLGDFNTDPGRSTEFDPSAAYLAEQVQASGMGFVTEVGPDAPGSYATVYDIDHVISDVLDGDCWHAGLGEHEPVSEVRYLDHLPVVCQLSDSDS